MTFSYTRSTSFTIVHARQLSSKVAADMHLCALFYGEPSEHRIRDYAEELAQMLNEGYVEQYEFGYKRNEKRVVCWRYVVQDGRFLAESRSGKVVSFADVTGAVYCNFMSYRACLVGPERPRAEQLQGHAAGPAYGRQPTIRRGRLLDPRPRLQRRADRARPAHLQAQLMTGIDRGIFEEVKEFPDNDARRRFAALVGLDRAKQRLLKEAQLLLDQDALAAWSKKHHGCQLPLVATFRDRPGLFLFAGDVGTGKTALAESFGDAGARVAEGRFGLKGPRSPALPAERCSACCGLPHPHRPRRAGPDP